MGVVGEVGGMGGPAGTAVEKEKEAAVEAAAEVEATAAEMEATAAEMAATRSARPQTQDTAAFVISTTHYQYPCFPLPSRTQVCHLHCLPLRKTER